MVQSLLPDSPLMNGTSKTEAASFQNLLLCRAPLIRLDGKREHA